MDASGSTFINPIERWTDNNYAPYELDYVYNQNTETSDIIVPLHGYRAQDIHVAGNVLLQPPSFSAKTGN